MTRVALVAIVAALVGSVGTSALGQEQVVHLQYDTSVARPAYTERHPAVLFDEAHHNLHTASGLYQPFVSLIANDGYRVTTKHENELLGNHPIIWGRGPSEHVNRVITYSSQSLLGPRGSVAFLRLADSAMDRSPVDNTLIPAAGRSQGLAFSHGKGRVVVLGEAGALSAQFDPGGQPFGINVEGTGNRQLALNIMHWLSGLIPVNSPLADRKQSSSRRSSSSRRAKSRTSKQGPVENSQP